MKVRATSWFKPAQSTRLSRLKLVQLASAWKINLDDGRWVFIPEGFTSDGFSAPNLAWPVLFANALQVLVTGAAHDYSVRRGARIQTIFGAVPFTERTATEFADAVAKFSHVNSWDRFWMRRALNLAAPTYWQKKGLMWTPQDLN